jgi:hypothetical protein
VAIVWPCPLTVDAYAAAGREVQVPRPDCLLCAGPLGAWRFASSVTGGTLLAANTISPWLVVGKRRFMPPVPP